ncbi:hypothetical protein TSUD_215790 [Trifolium subterraneum]|uniref:Replication factor A C-terminal domain-containing protein n=1 Tax=Trifolium subterraneum TaxID=3900 RepID=A0A2Z6M8F7_TRISU|nr:hypothetical protein TSUD_215790 [Trifolium subterraneum]
MVRIEKAKVDDKFTDVCEIDVGKEDLCIKVRVICMWKVPQFSNPSEFSSLEMVLMDEKHGKIHASVRRHLIYMFEGKLEEDKVYEISGFSIFPETRFYRPTLHPYKILFLLKTRVRPSESSSIPELDKASIQNVMNTTMILINPDIPDVESFKNSIVVHGIDSGSSVTLIGDRGKPSLEEEFLRMHPKKTVSELVDVAEDGVFVVCAEVVGIVYGQDWWYPACRCHKSVIPDSGAYFCTACDRHVFQVVLRFRVKFEVSDRSGTCVLVVFDSEMCYMMEKSCAFFVAQSKKISPTIDVESDGVSGHSNADEDSQSVEFMKELIVSPPAANEVDGNDSDDPFILKRNLNKAFDEVGGSKSTLPLKKVKIEKD